MDENQETALSTIVRQAQQKALKIIEAHSDALSFVRREEIDTQGLFLPVVTVLNIPQSDFHNLGGGVLMPKRHHVDRMAEAAGVNILSVDVGHVSEYVWVGKAHGTKRMPDGMMRHGEANYEYDAEKRAELDVLTRPENYSSEAAKRRHLLETAKFGNQRASTGARLALIRFFCKSPTGFKAEEIRKAMIFSRVDVNIDGQLSDPSMRRAAIQHAQGVAETIYGPTVRDVTPAPAAIAQDAGLEIPAEEVQEPPADDFKDDIPWDESPEDIARRALGNFLMIEKLHPDAKRLIQEMLDNKEATLEALTNLVERTNVWLDKARIPRPVATAKGGAA